MKYNRLISLAVFSFIISISLQAQINLRPGYVITNSNDTIHGFIDFRTDMRNAHQCTFKDPVTNALTNYQPGDIYAYRFTDDGKFYVTRTLSIEDKEQTLFLEYIIQGIISLYYYMGEKPYYFFEMEDGQMIEISQQEQKEIITEDGRKGYKKDNRYVGMLNYIFSKSEQVRKKVRNIHVGKFSLAELTKDYHNEVCETGQECIEFESRKDKRFITLSYTLTAGVKHQTYSLDGKAFLWNVDEMKSVSPSVGFELGLTIPRWSRIIGANVSLDVSKLTGEKDRLPTTNAYFKLKVDAIAIGNRIGIRLHPFKTSIKPYIEAGYYQSYLAGLKVEASIQRYEVDVVKEYKTDFANEASDFLFGYYVKAGVNIPLRKHQLSVYAYYQQAKNEENKFKTAGLSAGFTF